MKSWMNGRAVYGALCFLAILTVLIFQPGAARCQTYTIGDLYGELPDIVGVDVIVEAFYTNPADHNLVADYDAFQDDEVMPPQSIVYLDGATPPVSMWYGAWVSVTGTVDTFHVDDPYWPEDDVQIILRNISYGLLKPGEGPVGPEGEIPEEPDLGAWIPYRATCDSCKFAILVSGGAHHNHARYWNNIEMLYKLKVDSLGYCPHNVFVLYWKGDSEDSTAIPHGSVDSCTVANVRAAHETVAKRIAECHRRNKKATLQSLITDHGRGDGRINMLGSETMTPQQYRGMIQACIDSCLGTLYVEMVQCYGGQAADSLRSLNDKAKTTMRVSSAAGGQNPHRSDVHHADGGWATYLKRKIDALRAGKSYEEAVRNGLAAYDSLLKAQGLEGRRGNSVNWRSFPMKEYCEWQLVEVPPGGQLILDFSGESSSCGNCTVWEIRADGTIRKVTLNWNVSGSAGHQPGNERRVVNADSTSTGLFLIHNDDSQYRLIVSSSQKQTLPESYSNAHEYAGFSLGGNDSSSDEFTMYIEQPDLYVYNVDADGFNLQDLPAVIGPFAVEHLFVTYTNYPNPYWDDMELVFNILDVTSPGDLTVQTASENPEITLYVDEPGSYVVPLGAVWGDYIEINGTFLPKDRQALAAFTLDSWGLRVAQGLTDIADTPLPRTRPLAIHFANPFPAGSSIRFAIERQSRVKLTVFDVRGRLVTTLMDGPRPAGDYTIRWDGKDADGRRLASGVYFVRLSASGETVTTKMLVLE